MGYYNYYGWRPYVPVAEKRRRAEKKLAKLKTRGASFAPVKIEGRTIARSFWGKSWCTNLERYSDYENRLPRGRSYIRNGAVLDLQIARGTVVAMVAGSDLYKITIAIAPVALPRWKSICRDCAGTIDSLVELLQGRLAKGIMDRVCRKGDGLFPQPKEIKLSCSCPDWADMCKHVAAALYGVGAKLDEQPELLFVLRGVDEKDLIASAGQDLSLTKAASPAPNVLDGGDVAALFGLDMAEPDGAPIPAPTAPKRLRRLEVAKPSKQASAKKKKPVPVKNRASSRTRAKSGSNQAPVPARKTRAGQQPQASASRKIRTEF